MACEGFALAAHRRPGILTGVTQPTQPNALLEVAQALTCQRLIKQGHRPGTDPIWLARLLVSQVVARALVARLVEGE